MTKDPSNDNPTPPPADEHVKAQARDTVRRVLKGNYELPAEPPGPRKPGSPRKT